EWREFLREMASRGFVIDAIEFHQSSFEIDSNGNAVSVFDVLLNAANGAWSHRWSFKSKLRVDWTDEIDEEGHFIPGDLTLFDTHVLDRVGPAVFERHILEPNNLGITIPIVYDMNRDGFSDILLPLNNVLMLNAGDGKFEERKAIFDSYIYPLTGPATAVVADFDADGKVDLLFAGTYNFKKNFVTMTSEVGVYLYRGKSEGRSEMAVLHHQPPVRGGLDQQRQPPLAHRSPQGLDHIAGGLPPHGDHPRPAPALGEHQPQTTADPPGGQGRFGQQGGPRRFVGEQHLISLWGRRSGLVRRGQEKQPVAHRRPGATQGAVQQAQLAKTGRFRDGLDARQ
ncbi:MAG: VCBS repeat-containing protein, partial [SAR324 cluster bacterium]|nr:VCBS repeat-containing protein [SAR324 cluster bacterium]